MSDNYPSPDMLGQYLFSVLNQCGAIRTNDEQKEYLQSLHQIAATVNKRTQAADIWAMAFRKLTDEGAREAKAFLDDMKVEYA